VVQKKKKNLYRIEITGIFRAQPSRVLAAQRTVRSVYRTYIDSIHFRLSDTKRIKVNQLDRGENEYFTE